MSNVSVSILKLMQYYFWVWLKCPITFCGTVSKINLQQHQSYTLIIFCYELFVVQQSITNVLGLKSLISSLTSLILGWCGSEMSAVLDWVDERHVTSFCLAMYVKHRWTNFTSCSFFCAFHQPLCLLNISKISHTSVAPKKYQGTFT